MSQINPKEKTIVFCASQEHAAMVRDMVNQWAVKQGITQNPAYCVRVTAHDGKDGETDLRQFQNNDRTIPTILTTSRKLSTGVDAPNVRNIVLMRPCNNMIEFKQIVGRGTRLYEGKAFFTIVDFDKAYHNFSDPEWDGEPLPPEAPEPTGTPEPTPAPSISPQPTESPQPPTEKIIIQLSDGQARKIKQHLASTLYWFKGGLVTAHVFIQNLYDDLPSLFHNEDELRAIWSNPSTRDSLLNQLRDAEYTDEKLNEMSQLIGAIDSDVYDLLAYIAFEKETHTRAERVETALPKIQQAFSHDTQQAFIQFVLNQYVREGVSQLSQDNMKGLLVLKYGDFNDGVQQLGGVDEVKRTFIGFQGYLYGNDNANV
jgi:type I restriction enzyme R subunit